MRSLKLTVAYDGGAYAGWQVQPNDPTVQATLETAWGEITGEKFAPGHARLTAAGRTDSGVHALGQVVGILTESRLTNNALHRGLNAKLPADVAVLALENAPADFHATHDAVSKLYRYEIHNGRVPRVFDRHVTWHYPQPLDAEAMHTAGQLLVGRYDFSSFESAGSPRPDSVRTVLCLSVKRDVERDVERGRAGGQERITIEVEGDGFLYNMVRAIVGTLVTVGRGVEPIDWVAEVLATKDRRRAGQTAPAKGLCLVSVRYEPR